MPVIRRDPAAGAPSSAQAGRSPAAEAGRPVPSEGQSQSGNRQGSVARPTDANELLDKALEEVKGALAEQHLRTQTRMVRGLEALDNRDIERHRATQESFEAGIREVAASVDALKHEIHILDRSARRQVDELSERIDSALEGVVEVLRHMKSEITAIHYSLDASGTEARIHSQSSRSPEEESP